jgi:hypothetical protein
MAASRNPESALVRLGHLCFDDFLLLSPETMDFGLWTQDMVSDWSIATNNAPHVLLHFRGSVNLQPAICNLQPDCVRPCPSTSSIASAQARLVSAFAYDLLRAKAPPLYDALPWHDWDFSIVAKRFKLWQTRVLLAGDGTTVTMCRCRKTAGVYVLEPCETIARYVQRKAEIEKVRRFRLLRSAVSSPYPQSLVPIPLPDNSVDLAIIGSIPSLDTGFWDLAIRDLLRVAANVLLLENNPLSHPLGGTLLTDAGFQPASVDVRGLGSRRCWWLLRHSSP